MVAANAYQINVTAGTDSLFDPNQLFEISNVHSGLALEDYDLGTVNGSKVDQWEWISGNNQLWKITPVGGSYEFANKVSGKALDVYDAATSDGGTIDQWKYSGSSNQLWSITAR
jgi:hypothetical protein